MEGKYKYSQESLLQALERVREGSMSIRQASREYGVPYGTLGDKLRGRRPVKATPKYVLTHEEEEHLSQWIIELGKKGFGCTRDEIKDAVKRILDARGATTKFTDNRPGKFWVTSFFQRHPNLAIRTPQALRKEKALVMREGLEKWFRDLKTYILEQDPSILSSPDRIWNADESGFSLTTKAKKVVVEKGEKHPYLLSGNTKSQVTVLACHSASGQFLPPLIIYPYKRLPSENLLEGFPEAHFQISGNEWITGPIFHTWLRDVFIPGMEGRKRPILLLVDGHSSHSALIETSTLCADNGIILYCLKAHSSHCTQPLDQAFFAAIKPAWENSAHDFLFDTGENVSLRTFASVFKKAWDSAATQDMALKGFSASGIYPFNPSKVLSSEKLGPSLLFSSDGNTSSTELRNPSSSTASSTSNSQSSSAFSKQLSNFRKLTDIMFLIGKEKCQKFIDCYEARESNAHVAYHEFSNLLHGLFTPVCLSSAPPSCSGDCPPLTSHLSSSVSCSNCPHSSESVISNPSVSSIASSSQPCCSVQLGPSTYDLSSTSTAVSYAQAQDSKSFFLPQTSTTTSSLNVLKLPLYRKSQTQEKQQNIAMPMALSGSAYIELLKRMEEEKDEALRMKEQKKKEREANKKKRAKEKENLKRKREEAKEIRKKKRDEKEAKKKRKRDEAALKKALKEFEKEKRVDEETESESSDDE